MLFLLFFFSYVTSNDRQLLLIEYGVKTNFCDIFGEVMIRNRYFTLLGMLHFTHDVGVTNDRLCKIRNIIDMLRKTFSDSFQPYQWLCIDESLLLYKGQLHFKQYIPAKRSRFGIKSFIISDYKTGYVQDIIVYARSIMVDTKNKAIGK